MANSWDASKELEHGEFACPHDAGANLGCALAGKINDQGGHTARAMSELGAPDSQPANPIPVCSFGNR
jgi:hypothetical protein